MTKEDKGNVRNRLSGICWTPEAAEEKNMESEESLFLCAPGWMASTIADDMYLAFIGAFGS